MWNQSTTPAHSREGSEHLTAYKTAASVLAASNTFNEGWGSLVYRTGSSISEIMPTHKFAMTLANFLEKIATTKTSIPQ